MLIMDFKGITWVGKIYQKFEAMCLEVEEAVCEDTVKFVEIQAQTVGSSVKKFYSDVMQDLLPPSSIDPVKLAAADLSLNPYADYGICKKQKASGKKDTMKTDKQLSEDSRVIAGVNTGYSSSFSGLHDADHFQPSYSIGPVKGAGLELCLEPNERRGVYKRKSRRCNYMPSERSRSITPISKDLSRVSSSCETSENHKIACGRISMVSRPASDDGTGCDSSGAKSHEVISGSSTVSTAGSIDTPTPDMIFPVESGADNETKLRCPSSNSGSDVLAAGLNGTNTNSRGVSLVGSYKSGDPQHSESASDDRLSPTGDCNLDENENYDFIMEAGMDTINEQLDKSKLEDTCVLVDKEEIAAHKKDKPRSYKKKIQKAFSSKRSARKQEYEQLAVHHEDMEAGSNHESAESLVLTLTMDADTKKSPPGGIDESEWEVL